MTSVFQIPRLPTSGSHQRWSGLSKASLALTAAQIAQANDGICVLITGTTAQAETLTREIEFFTANNDELADELQILHFPDRETLPYDSFSPHQDILSERLATLYQLPNIAKGILITPISNLMHRLPPTEYIVGNCLFIQTGQRLDGEQLAINLSKAGYHRVETVFEHGEYAVRGSLVDVYPMGCDTPFRIDFFDDEIENLRSFDAETQLTIEKLDSIELLPASEIPLTALGIKQFKDHWHDHFAISHRDCPLFQDVIDGIAPAGIEYYLPLFFEQTSLLADYLPSNALILATQEVSSAAEMFCKDVGTRYEERNIDARRPLLAPDKVFASFEETFGSIKNLSRINLHSDSIKATQEFSFAKMPALSVDAKSNNPWQKLESFMLEHDHRVLFCAESAGRREALSEQLTNLGLKPQLSDNWQAFIKSNDEIAITSAPIEQGLLLDDPNIALITESQLYGGKILQSRRRQKEQGAAENIVRNLTELRINAPVVHIDHGVGRYLGLETITVDNQNEEFLALAYAEGAKLYVPVSSLHLINRYSGADDELAPMHKLGNDQWSKAKEKAAKDVRDTAAELLKIYANRAAKPGRSMVVPEDSYRQFCDTFPFEETVDQENAINAVVADLVKPSPMDRLVCGDVGFGKTEVAIRAAFISVHNDGQVAILVPTTLLAQQHYETFRDRFADLPISIEVLSRFRSSKELEAAKKKIADGKVDIIIGTHKLLQPDIKYHNLGLLVIDEEHRFGVKHKEQMKALRAEVDILTLTATPIPRTLNMAMGGMRDLSIIATPPARRLSVKTFVQQKDNATLKEAILREILRGGQVYYLHNEVKSIEQTARELEELLPEARVGIAHGQMRESELEQVMSEFYHKHYNVLVCTTIIETGIDIPSANTIIMDRADKLGLAQLHQLRGRVGRSHHQAYAYLLTPDNRAMTKDAEKRLDAISETTDLGAGFTLATHDMEIRGAGELLGDGQSGNILGIGFTLYMEMLNRAVTAIQKGESFDLDQPLENNAEINLRIPALIPDEYLPDINTRLTLYKRISGAETKQDLKELQVEMIDRFGLLPQEVKNLIIATELRIEAMPLGIIKLEAGAKGGRIEFRPNTNIDPMALVKLVQQQPNLYKLQGGNKLVFDIAMIDAQSRITTVSGIINYLTNNQQKTK